jgi:hypothetical protein
VDIDEARAEVRRILEADLAELAVDRRGALFPPVGQDEWELPRQDMDVLWRHGLPAPQDDGPYRISGHYQTGSSPELAHEGRVFYRLGSFAGVSHLAERGTGEVVHPVLTKAEVHPQLAVHFPVERTFALVDTSVASWVELAWRWHRLVPVLVDQSDQAGEAEGRAMRGGVDRDLEPPDFFAEVEEMRREILAAFRARDPAAIASKQTFWWDVVMDL